MRTIKFRAFDPIKKEMWHNQFSITSSGHIQKNEPAREYHSWKNEDWILMQFTGLQDCKGIDIYEGDIINIGQFLFEVIYDEDSFKLKEVGADIILFSSLADVCRYSLVVTSVYENPEPEFAEVAQ